MANNLLKDGDVNFCFKPGDVTYYAEGCDFIRFVYRWTTPDRMRNVLAYMYDKSIMRGPAFLPVPGRPLDGASILNNVLACLAAVEVDYPVLRSIALVNLQVAIGNVKKFFSDHSEEMQALVDEANELEIPPSEWDFLTPAFVRNHSELQSFYTILRIALQAMNDMRKYRHFMFYSDGMMPLRGHMFLLVHAIYKRLMLSKKFRTEEQPKWEEMGLMSLFKEEERCLAEYGGLEVHGWFNFQEPDATWHLALNPPELGEISFDDFSIADLF